MPAQGRRNWASIKMYCGHNPGNLKGPQKYNTDKCVDLISEITQPP